MIQLSDPVASLKQSVQVLMNIASFDEDAIQNLIYAVGYGPPPAKVLQSLRPAIKYQYCGRVKTAGSDRIARGTW
jgi:hypothetical protein